MSFWTSIASLLTAALSLLGFAQANPSLPQAQQQQIVQTTQQIVSQASNAIASNPAPLSAAESSGSSGAATGGTVSSSGMQTYTDAAYGFQFSYPSSFWIEDPNEINQTGYDLYVPLSTTQDPLLTVHVTVSGSVNYCDNDSQSDKLGSVPGTPIVKNGATFYAGTTEDAGAGSTDEGFVDATVHNGYCYQISSDIHFSDQVNSSSEIASSEADAKSIVDQIASTFKFIVPNSTSINTEQGSGAGFSTSQSECNSIVSNGATLKLGDTDATTNGRVSALQSFLGVTPVSGTYGPKTQLAYENECGGGNAQPVSVAGMSKYTDSDFGFSFWYPSGWNVAQVPPIQTGFGGTVAGQIEVSSSGSSITIQEVDSTSGSITDASGGGADRTCPASSCDTITYFFDPNTGQWMQEYPPGAGQQHQTGVSLPADVSQNTMGGLHIFAGSSRYGYDSIIPLSADHFLVISYTQGPGPGQLSLAQTIMATDSSVGLWASTAQQSATIEAEQQAYAGE